MSLVAGRAWLKIRGTDNVSQMGKLFKRQRKLFTYLHMTNFCFVWKTVH